MATLTKGYTFSSTEQVTAAKLHSLVDSATISNIVAAEITDSTITDAKISSIGGAKLLTLGSTPAGAGILPVANGGTGLAAYTQGDVPYASGATTIAKLGAGTAGQALTTGGASANPSFAGMTTQGDIEYHNGTTRTKLTAGTAGQVLTTGGASANPSWSTHVGTRVDKSGGYAAQVSTTAAIIVISAVATANSARLKAYTDTNADPTTLVADVGQESTYRFGLTFIVQRGHYWKLVATDCTVECCSYYPLGG